MKRTFLFLLIGLSLSYGCTTDNIQKNTVTTFDLIPNYDFENWVSSPAPEWLFPGWTTNNTYAISATEVDPDSDAYHGHFAMKLINYNISPPQAETKFPITIHPLSLQAFVKCNLASSDTVSIRIKLFFMGKEIDGGAWFGTTSIDNYKQINIPITQHAAVVDTALIEITGGDHLTNNQLGKGSEFWVDYLSLQNKQ